MQPAPKQRDQRALEISILLQVVAKRQVESWATGCVRLGASWIMCAIPTKREANRVEKQHNKEREQVGAHLPHDASLGKQNHDVTTTISRPQASGSTCQQPDGKWSRGQVLQHLETGRTHQQTGVRALCYHNGQLYSQRTMTGLAQTQEYAETAGGR